MMHSTRNTRSPTCILSFDGGSNLQQLAETVHSLRVSVGRRACIVVQEKEASLGHQSEALLLRLGLNLVIHRDVPTARLPALLKSLSGQVFKHDVEVSFEAAVGSAFPPNQSGYFSAQAFAQEVSASLDRAEKLGTSCAMVTGKPMPGVTIADILTNNVLGRPGDMMTSDGGSCYIFLNACLQSEILETLEKILGMPIDTAFDDPKLFIQSEEIQPELAKLLRAAERGEAFDVSLRSKTPQTRKDSADSISPENLASTFAKNTLTSANSATVAVAPASPLTARSPVVSQAKVKQVQLPISVQSEDPTPLAATVMPALTNLALQKTSLDRLSDVSTEEPLFSYDSASEAPAFGKKEVPRASRSVSR